MTFSWSHHPYACDDSGDDGERPTVAGVAPTPALSTGRQEEIPVAFSPLPTPGSCRGGGGFPAAEAVEPMGPLRIQVNDLTSMPALATPLEPIQSPAPPVYHNRQGAQLAYVTTPNSPPEVVYRGFPGFAPMSSPTVIQPAVYADPTAAYARPAPAVAQPYPVAVPAPGPMLQVPPAPTSEPPLRIGLFDLPAHDSRPMTALVTPTQTPKDEMHHGFLPNMEQGEGALVAATTGCTTFSQGLKTPNSEEHFVISPRRFDTQDEPRAEGDKKGSKGGKKKKKYFLTVEFKWGVTVQVQHSEPLTVGTHVLVARQRGVDMGMVVGQGKGGGGDEVLRTATADEVDEWKTEQKRVEGKIVKMVRRLAQVHQVPLRIHFVGLQFDKRRVTIHYSSDQTHPDFRRLVAACHSRLRCSIWMNNCRPPPGAPGERVPDNHPGFPALPQHPTGGEQSSGQPLATHVQA
eukprot:Hpha_TRINITY_DN16954_c0_g5::TRINITY_DN16954_c0_g5_i1::g.56144::m.56144